MKRKYIIPKQGNNNNTKNYINKLLKINKQHSSETYLMP